MARQIAQVDVAPRGPRRSSASGCAGLHRARRRRVAAVGVAARVHADRRAVDAAVADDVARLVAGDPDAVGVDRVGAAERQSASTAAPDRTAPRR